MRKKICFIMAAVMMSAMLLIGCGGDEATTGNNGSLDYSVNDTASIDGYGTKFTAGMSDTFKDVEGNNKSQVSESSSATSSSKTSEENERKLIRTVSLDMELENSNQLTDVMESTSALAKKHQGYVPEQSQDNGYNSRGSMTARIPKSEADDFLTELKNQDVAKISNYSDDLEDVTLQYTDIDSRLQSAKAAKERYMALLGTAVNVSDVLAIQERIDEIIANEESFQRQLSAMDSKIEYTTIQITYRCLINQDRPNLASRISQTASNLWEDAGDTFLHAFSWFILCIIWLIFALPIMCLIIRVFLFALGKKKRTKKQKTETSNATSEDLENKNRLG